ncbi:hypothetical protein I7I53_11171 [Histoplasma capsulatum var. duboisii H88]|uniref:Uncharacterized protein n=1 Tax=Ajellomyces capsulatus (strain H88) TaxID=544711 RepID=A0A8A1LEQ2_AJEC8|nr:hypothetical protein I7I53_11171 [Histoplasma capsulatum var. duboisii H88]
MTMNATKDEKNDNKNKKTCNHCKRNGHEEFNCWDKYPEKKPENLRKASTVEPANVIEEQVF